MARLLVYDAYENKVYTYSSLRENDPMPYSTGRTLTVREFRGKSNSPVLWTTIAQWKRGTSPAANTAEASRWDTPSAASGREATAPAANTMPAWPRCGQSLSQTQRTAIYNAARSTGAWGYVEPLSQTPTWVHFDRRYGTPACRGTTQATPPSAGAAGAATS